MNFIAIDFETANRDRSSICQVGIAEFQGRECVESTAWLVDPEQQFDEMCVDVHGITPDLVDGSPRFREFYEAVLGPRLADRVIVCHTSFDRVALERACERHGHPTPAASWLDSATLARRVWPEVSRSGYGLRNLATTRLGIEFRHHDAGEDARAAGLVVLAAAESLGLDLEGCLSLVSGAFPRSRARSGESSVQRRASASEVEQEEKELRRILTELVHRTAAQDDPPLAGERVAITGRLQLQRKEVGSAIEALGGTWDPRVSMDTTMLVVGTQNEVALKGKEKSSNQEKAERFRSQGREIQIFTEAEWLDLLREIYDGSPDEA